MTISSLLRKSKKTILINPARDWSILLILFLIALACIIVWNLHEFDVAAGGNEIGSATVTQNESSEEKDLDTLHTIFTSRASEVEKYETGAYSYKDPSQ